MNTKAYFINIKAELTNQLKSAKSSIQLAVAWLTDEDLIREMAFAAQERGVSVSGIISNSDQNFINPGRFKKFLDAGANLYVCTSIFMHHKFCVIDNDVLINGSYNWSYTARGSEENITVSRTSMDTESPLLLKQFESRFEKVKKEYSIKIERYQELGKFDKILGERVLDPEETRLMELHKKLENRIQESIRISKELGVALNYVDLQSRIVRDGGGANFIHRILREEISDNTMKSGFRKLEEFIPNKVELSLEYLVCLSEYRELFNKEELNFCLKQMHKYNLFLETKTQ